MQADKVKSLVFTPFPNSIQNALYLNAKHSAVLESRLVQPAYLQQIFKPEHEFLSAPAVPDFPPEAERFSAVLIHGTKNTIETKYLIAKGVSVLKEGGTLSICANNKTGGNRLEKLLKEIGFENADSYSKYKARVAWGSAPRINQDVLNQWLEQGSLQDILKGEYQSQPGIFGWDKIDKGSALLLKHLPPPGPQGQTKIFKGKGADFGCGYGYLSKELLGTYKTIKHMTCLDADHRAVKACRMNTENLNTETTLDYVWGDLTQPTTLKNLDFIIMNPPFHEGKNTDQSIGKSFIETASAALKKNGQLWMVANNHLSYEPILEKNFFKVENIHEGQGFKVFKAVK